MNAVGRSAALARSARAALPLPPSYPTRLVDQLTLRDGRNVLLRPILPQDADLEQTFLSQLAPQTRRRRFHFGVNSLPVEVVRRFSEIDYRSHVALIAEAADDDEAPHLVADARYVASDDERSAEFALVVADAWQGAGLGREMMRRLAQHAARDGVRLLVGDVLSENEPMLALARSLGARIVPNYHDASLQQARWVL